MPPDKQNRIDVDLHLLASEDIKLLQGIANQLSSALSGSGGSGGAGSWPSNAGYSYTMGGSRNSGMQPASAGDAAGPGGPGVPPSGSHAPGGADGDSGLGFGKTFYNPWLESMFGKGGKYTSGGGITTWPGRSLGFAQGTGRDIDALSMAAMGFPNVVSAMTGAINSPLTMARSMGNVSYGGNLGMSTQNGPIPMLSSAGIAGLMNQTVNPLSSFFNLNFSPGMATSANQAIAQFGYNPGAGGTRGDQMFQAIQSIQSQYGSGTMDASQIAAMLDPARYGGSNIAALTAQIKSMGDAAKGANVSVQHYTQAMQQVSQQIAQQLGTSGQAAVGQVQSMSAATGFSPEVAGQPMMNQTVRGLMIGQAGGNIFNAFWGKNAGTNALHGVETITQGLLGMNFSQMGAALKGPNANALKNRIAAAYMANPQIFGGYTPEQLIELANRGDTKIYAGGTLSTEIQTGLTAGANGGHGAATLAQMYSEARKAGLSQSEIAKLAGGSGDYHDKVVALRSAMGKYNSKLQTQTANKTYVELTGYAKRILQKVVPDGSSSDSNTYPNAGASATLGGLIR